MGNSRDGVVLRAFQVCSRAEAFAPLQQSVNGLEPFWKKGVVLMKAFLLEADG